MQDRSTLNDIGVVMSDNDEAGADFAIGDCHSLAQIVNMCIGLCQAELLLPITIV